MRDDEIDLIIDALREIREREYLSMAGLARRLGFSAAHLSMIFAGKRRPGLRFVQAVRRRYPDLWAGIADRCEARGAREAEAGAGGVAGGGPGRGRRVTRGRRKRIGRGRRSQGRAGVEASTQSGDDRRR